MKFRTPIRVDKLGDGHYGTSRGDRKHRGVDFEAPVGSKALSACKGTVTRIGTAYSGDSTYKYVEVRRNRYNVSRKRYDTFFIRYFYLEPSVREGDVIFEGTCLGTVQDLTKRYPGITPHVHVELMNHDRVRIDPTEFFCGG